MKLYYQDCGTYTAVAIESDDPREIELQYNSLYNHGATDGELHYMSDRFAYVWTDEERLEKYFLNSSLALLLNDSEKYKSVEGGAMSDAKELAEIRKSNMKRDNFASNPSLRHVPDCFALGYQDHNSDMKQAAVNSARLYQDR
tara:strand:+ start:2027 stop:2455 length:429 start_codon:yes stop_codon:yes gene_type:complete